MKKKQIEEELQRLASIMIVVLVLVTLMQKQNTKESFSYYCTSKFRN